MATTTTLTTSSRAYTRSQGPAPQNVLLRARPYARYAGFFTLVPLLPKRPPLKTLPAEVWRKIISMIIEDEEPVEKSGAGEAGGKGGQRERKWSKWNLTLVCKDLKNYALPLLYEICEIFTLPTLRKFTANLQASEQMWDSLRRIPYSTPGRWVQVLKLSEFEVTSQSDGYTADALLSTLFPLLPFLARLELGLSLQLSRRAFMSLGLRDGAQNLRVMTGIRYDASTVISGEDPLTELVSCCSGLEELEIVGTGPENLDALIDAEGATASSYTHFPSLRPAGPSLQLPYLHTFTLLATPKSALLLRLIHSPLPSLQNVIITPYGDLPPAFSLVSEFLTAHGPSIQSLVLHTPKSWPTVRFPPPTALLTLLPNVTALSLETLKLSLEPPTPNSPTHSPTEPAPRLPRKGHPLTALWIARPVPTVRAELLALVPHLPHLREVRARDVRWAKRGMSARALEAGFQGEMYAWRRLLAPSGIRMLDADGRDSAPI